MTMNPPANYRLNPVGCDVVLGRRQWSCSCGSRVEVAGPTPPSPHTRTACPGAEPQSGLGNQRTFVRNPWGRWLCFQHTLSLDLACALASNRDHDARRAWNPESLGHWIRLCLACATVARRVQYFDQHAINSSRNVNTRIPAHMKQTVDTEGMCCHCNRLITRALGDLVLLRIQVPRILQRTWRLQTRTQRDSICCPTPHIASPFVLDASDPARSNFCPVRITQAQATECAQIQPDNFTHVGTQTKQTMDTANWIITWTERPLNAFMRAI